MKGHAVRHVLRRAARSLWENLYLNSVAVGVIAAALLLMGVYLTVQYNVAAIVDTWSRDSHVSAYLAADSTEEERLALRDRLAADPRVASVRYVSEDEAARWLAEQVPELEGVLAELGPGTLPASLEIALRAEAATPEGIAAFAEELAAPPVDDVDFGREWVERFNAFLSLLRLLGAVLGILVLVAALFLVVNTVHLVVYNRRDEIETEKLVGATHGFILAPFLLEGLVDGVAGSAIALGALWALHRAVVLRLQDALGLALAGQLAFLPGRWLFLLASAGVVLGVGAALVAVHRFLLRAP